MKKYLTIIPIILLAAACNKQQTTTVNNPPPQSPPATTTASSTGSTPPLLSVKYDNKQYGFVFNLPDDWLGYSVVYDTWTGSTLDSAGRESPTDAGGLLRIRNPKWTKANPYEDIPVMVFTLDQWDRVQQQKLIVTAAPFGPGELGRNKKYVFALPPRYNYDFSTGYEEVETIISNHPLQAY